jgi:hypothetical protein
MPTNENQMRVCSSEMKRGKFRAVDMEISGRGLCQGCQVSLLRFILILRPNFFKTNFRKSYFLPIFVKNVVVFILPDLASLVSVLIC